MLPNVFALLKVAAPVTAIIGSPPRCYRHGRAPQGVIVPYVTTEVVAGAPENTLTGVPPADSFGVRVDCWSKDDTEVETLAAAVRDAVQDSAHMIAIVANDRDAVTNICRLSMQYEFWTSRS
jgi:hypothetical protein